MRLARRMLAVLLHAWPQKLGALALAVLIWTLVSLNDTSTTQRSLFVPISVEGLADDSVATGLPEFVEVTVAGPSGQVDRLRQENFEAILDLSGESGSFEAPIQVLSPQGVELRRVSPGDVIGSVEAVTNKTVPVHAVLIGEAPSDVRTWAQAQPAQATVRARASTLAQVARVLAPLPNGDDSTSVRPYAVNISGAPVGGVVIDPATIAVEVVREPILISRSLPVDLETPSVSNFTVTARMQEEEVTLLGPPTALSGLQQVQGSVTLPTEEPEAGGYTLPVTLELPEGVFQTSTPSATVRLARPPLEP